MKSDKISDKINCKGPSKTVNSFMSVKQYTFSDTLPLKCTDQQFGVQNKGLTQHNSYCATTKINPASKPAMSQMIPLVMYCDLQITINIVYF